MALLMNLVFPIGSVGCLLSVRRRFTFWVYFFCCVIFVGAAVVTWLCTPDILYYNHGRLNAAGFRSWALPIVALSIALICFFPVDRWYIRLLQFVSAFAVTNFFFSIYAGWLS